MSKVKLKNRSRRMRTYHNPLRSTRVQQAHTVPIGDGLRSGKKAKTQIVPTSFSILPGAESPELDERIVESDEVRRDIAAKPPILEVIRLGAGEDDAAEPRPKAAKPPKPPKPGKPKPEGEEK